MGDKIKLLREITPDDKLAPQQRVFTDVLTKVGVGKEIDRDELLKRVAADGKLVTRQTPERILGYYIPKFVDAGIFELIKAPKAPKAEKAEKPAKEKTPAEAPKKPEKAA
jgi:hypothetical protein